ncbi:uncharacterized protein LOC125843225 [Solanum stenotomum]|uniref:uncharacterized protein LOC125843225 n=1 Tax=Solanum stenotomum TaxID=172797 RepID=UPI0020D0FEC0|nr:uncharacterized protein LOC125843225 [Solanum stenotomum]
MSSCQSTGKMPEERLSIPGRPSCSKPEDEHLVEDLFFKTNIRFTLVGKQCLLGVDHQGHCCRCNFFIFSFTWFHYLWVFLLRSTACCWAFASTEAITAAHAFKNKETIPLSKQQLVDCIFIHYKKPSWFADLGPKQCFPSSCTKAYEFATDFGIVEETQYPFTEQRGDCKGPSPGVVRIVQYYSTIPSVPFCVTFFRFRYLNKSLFFIFYRK